MSGWLARHPIPQACFSFAWALCLAPARMLAGALWRVPPPHAGALRFSCLAFQPLCSRMWGASFALSLLRRTRTSSLIALNPPHIIASSAGGLASAFTSRPSHPATPAASSAPAAPPPHPPQPPSLPSLPSSPQPYNHFACLINLLPVFAASASPGHSLGTKIAL